MTELVDTPAPRRHRAVTWAPRVVLALVFVYEGVAKLPGGHGMWVRLFEQIGVGQWFRYVTALVEFSGGILILVPRATIVPSR